MSSEDFVEILLPCLRESACGNFFGVLAGALIAENFGGYRSYVLRSLLLVRQGCTSFTIGGDIKSLIYIISSYIAKYKRN